MKDFSSYGYMQGPIRNMILEDLNKMGVAANNYSQKRRASKIGPSSQFTDKYQGECGIYGKPLAELETRPVPGQPYIRVPRLLLRSCNFLSHHLETEGLFRKSGSVSRQKAIRISLNEGNGIDEDSNPHDVASLMKQFLRELPEPLLTHELYNPFIQSQMLEEEEDRMQAVLLLTLCLPDINRHTLQFLTRFLHSVSEKSSVNKMTTSNLAVVITPNVIRASCAANGGANIKLETQLLETIIQNSSEIGLVPEDIAQRAQTMILELSGIWGVSEQEAAYKLPLKGKRKRSGSLSGILTSVFKHSKTTTKHSVVLRPRPILNRKSISNQDLTLDTKMGNNPIHGDLSFSTPCIRTPGPARPVINTPLLTAQRRKALLRQTPVDPRKKPIKPTNIMGNVTDCPSPVEFDPPNKRSKLDMSPQTEPVKRKNFKQRLSEGLTSRYRKSRLKRKRSRAHRSSESSSTVTTTNITTTDMTSTVTDDQGAVSCDTPASEKRKKEKNPVFCFKAKPGSFNDQQKRLTYSSGISDTEVVINNCNVQPILDSPVQPELQLDYSPATYVKQLEQDGAAVTTPGVTTSTVTKKKLFPSPRLDDSTEDSSSPDTQNPEPPISPAVNLHRRRDSYIQSCQSSDALEEFKFDTSIQPKRNPKLRRSAPVASNKVQLSDTPILRRSPRLSSHHPSTPPLRSISGDSFTAARHSVSLNAVNITPQTFSRTSASKLQPFSPIRVSLNCIATSPAGGCVRLSPGREVQRCSLGSNNEVQRCSLGSNNEVQRCSLGSNKSGASQATISQSDLSNTRSETSDLTNDTTNLTDLFTSREITRLDMSLNVREFDKNFCQQLAQSTEKLAALQQTINHDLPATSSEIPGAGIKTEAEKDSAQEVGIEDSILISLPNPSDKTIDESLNVTAINNESHVTYITQNMSSFSANNTTCHIDPDTSRVDFPKFGSLPQLPPIIALEDNPGKFSPVKFQSSESSGSRSVLSELEVSDCVSRDVTFSTRDVTFLSRDDRRRVSSNSSVTTRTPTSAISRLTLAPSQTLSTLSPNSNCSESPTEKTSVSEICENSILSPPKISRVAVPEIPSGHMVPIKHNANAFKLSNMSLSHRNPPSTPGTPLNIPEQQRTDSRQAVVIRKQDSGLNSLNGVIAAGTDSAIPKSEGSSSHCPVEEGSGTVSIPGSRELHRQVLQDDQISSTVQESPIKENIPPENPTMITPNNPTTSSKTPGKTPRTPKTSTEVDLNKINITPRTKIPRGFTKNLASQWESMNSRETGTRASTRAATRKTRIPLRTASRTGSSSLTKTTKPAASSSQTTRKPKLSSESARREGIARATSVRSVTKPARALTRTKSDNAGKNTGTRPAWRF